MHPLLILLIGIVIVIGMIIALRVNAFVALITAALVVSVLAPGDWGMKIGRVATSFGEMAGKIGIIIAFAAVIGKCMMDSGAADRIVRAFLAALGQKRAPTALMGSGFVLAVPVFFDTVFYLLVPLARSLYRKTQQNYLLYLLAIGAGGAITHTLVPPTPGPLLMAANFQISIGVMMAVGALVALPSAFAGVVYAKVVDRWMPVPAREIEGIKEPDPLPDDELPSLKASLLPIVLPVILIGISTTTSYLADQHRFNSGQVAEQVANEVAAAVDDPTSEAEALGDNPWAGVAKWAGVFGNANFALLVSMVISLFLYYKRRKPTLQELGLTMEQALMSGGVIILITAGGGAFGAMLKVAGVGDAIREAAPAGGEGMGLLFLGFGIAVLLKVAQGSSTVAMITVSAMLADLVSGGGLAFHPVYLATAIGAGSLVGSWMNDSGFWIFAKMGGLTEAEALKSWTPMLVVLGATSFITTLILASVMPLV